MSELFDKEMNAQKESLKNFRGSHKLLHSHKKVCDENERSKKKRHTHKRKQAFISRTQRTGENELNKL